MDAAEENLRAAIAASPGHNEACTNLGMLQDMRAEQILRSGGDGGIVALVRAFRSMDSMGGEPGDGVLSGAELKVRYG